MVGAQGPPKQQIRESLFSVPRTLKLVQAPRCCWSSACTAPALIRPLACTVYCKSRRKVTCTRTSTLLGTRNKEVCMYSRGRTAVFWNRLCKRVSQMYNCIFPDPHLFPDDCGHALAVYRAFCSLAALHTRDSTNLNTFVASDGNCASAPRHGQRIYDSMHSLARLGEAAKTDSAAPLLTAVITDTEVMIADE